MSQEFPRQPNRMPTQTQTQQVTLAPVAHPQPQSASQLQSQSQAQYPSPGQFRPMPNSRRSSSASFGYAMRDEGRRRSSVNDLAHNKHLSSPITTFRVTSDVNGESDTITPDSHDSVYDSSSSLPFNGFGEFDDLDYNGNSHSSPHTELHTLIQDQVDDHHAPDHRRTYSQGQTAHRFNQHINPLSHDTQSNNSMSAGNLATKSSSSTSLPKGPGPNSAASTTRPSLLGKSASSTSVRRLSIASPKTPNKYTFPFSSHHRSLQNGNSSAGTIVNTSVDGIDLSTNTANGWGRNSGSVTPTGNGTSHSLSTGNLLQSLHKPSGSDGGGIYSYGKTGTFGHSRNASKNLSGLNTNIANGINGNNGTPNATGVAMATDKKRLVDQFYHSINTRPKHGGKDGLANIHTNANASSVPGSPRNVSAFGDRYGEGQSFSPDEGPASSYIQRSSANSLGPELGHAIESEASDSPRVQSLDHSPVKEKPGFWSRGQNYTGGKFIDNLEDKHADSEATFEEIISQGGLMYLPIDQHIDEEDEGRTDYLLNIDSVTNDFIGGALARLQRQQRQRQRRNWGANRKKIDKGKLMFNGDKRDMDVEESGEAEEDDEEDEEEEEEEGEDGSDELKPLVVILQKVADDMMVQFKQNFENIDYAETPTSMNQLDKLSEYLHQTNRSIKKLFDSLLDQKDTIKSKYQDSIRANVSKLDELVASLETLEKRLSDAKQSINRNKEMIANEVYAKFAILEQINQRFDEHAKLIRNRRFKQLNICLAVLVVLCGVYVGVWR